MYDTIGRERKRKSEKRKGEGKECTVTTIGRRSRHVCDVVLDGGGNGQNGERDIEK